MPKSQDKILVADDEAAVRKGIAKLLAKRGHIVLEAKDGEEALKVFQEERPKLVLLDLKMPRMDGLETLKGIKTLEPDARIVIITASLIEGLKVELEAEGAFECLQKPVDVEQLESILELTGF